MTSSVAAGVSYKTRFEVHQVEVMVPVRLSAREDQAIPKTLFMRLVIGSQDEGKSSIASVANHNFSSSISFDDPALSSNQWHMTPVTVNASTSQPVLHVCQAFLRS